MTLKFIYSFIIIGLFAACGPSEAPQSFLIVWSEEGPGITDPNGLSCRTYQMEKIVNDYTFNSRVGCVDQNQIMTYVAEETNTPIESKAQASIASLLGKINVDRLKDSYPGRYDGTDGQRFGVYFMLGNCEKEVVYPAAGVLSAPSNLKEFFDALAAVGFFKGAGYKKSSS